MEPGTLKGASKRRARSPRRPSRLLRPLAPTCCRTSGGRSRSRSSSAAPRRGRRCAPGRVRAADARRQAAGDQPDQPLHDVAQDDALQRTSTPRVGCRPATRACADDDPSQHGGGDLAQGRRRQDHDLVRARRSARRAATDARRRARRQPDFGTLSALARTSIAHALARGPARRLDPARVAGRAERVRGPAAHRAAPTRRARPRRGDGADDAGLSSRCSISSSASTRSSSSTSAPASPTRWPSSQSIAPIRPSSSPPRSGSPPPACSARSGISSSSRAPSCSTRRRRAARRQSRRDRGQLPSPRGLASATIPYDDRLG